MMTKETVNLAINRGRRNGCYGVLLWYHRHAIAYFDKRGYLSNPDMMNQVRKNERTPQFGI